MKAVFSFWDTTNNLLINATNWLNPKFHLYSWVLSVTQAAKFFEEVELVTTSDMKVFFENLNLPFTNIRTDLDELSEMPKSFWSLGKIKAYEIQDKPFIHIDADVILYKNLPKEILNSELAFQNLEPADWFERCYEHNWNLINEKGLVTKNWNNIKEAYCMGFYVCNNMDYNKEYCKQVMDLALNNKDLMIKSGSNYENTFCLLFEQYIAQTVATQMNIKPSFLLPHENLNLAVMLGYVHIWGGKHSQDWFKNIEDIVLTQYPKHYKLINNLCSNT